MLEKPDLPDGKIIARLRERYGVQAAAIKFLPLGNDSSAWVYRVTAGNGEAFFLKVKKGTVEAPGVLIPRYLKDHGIAQVVAPLPAKSPEPWRGADDFDLLLYPFVEGRPAMEVGLSDDQWIEYGAFLKELHSTALPPDLFRQLPRETFTPKWGGFVRAMRARIDGAFADPFEKELAAFWKEKDETIEHIVRRAEALGRVLQQRSLEFVLCHADVHTANLLVDQEGCLFVVDWDGLLLAPRERDLMFVAGAPVEGFVMGTREEELFFRGYGATDVDWAALAYYRYEWVVQDIGDYGERVFSMQDSGPETKEHAVRGFLALFQPGDVVEAALKSEEKLPPHLRSGLT